MRRTIQAIAIVLACASVATAETFVPRPYLAEAGVSRLTREVSNRMMDRDLFGTPWATVIVGNVDVYEGFPYLESRHFQVVSDPEWNRLLLGETGQGLAAFDGKTSSVGELKEPRGMAVDDQGRVYVADTGNDRVLVFRTVTEYDAIRLEPVQVIDGLAAPYDVAVSDGGTPFEAEDDRLYVANAGANEIRRYTKAGADWQDAGALGTLGSGPGHFAGPMALEVGRTDGSNSDDIYVSDAHNARLVQLKDDGAGLAWVRDWPHQLGVVTSLTSDHWGNVYATAPRAGGVVKYNKSLDPVASLAGDVQRPRSFHVPFVTVRDHRNGTVERVGEGGGILVEEWTGETGLRAVDLGVDLREASVTDAEQVTVKVMLTDNANVVAEIRAPGGEVVSRHDAGHLEPGTRTFSFDAQDHLRAWDAGTYEVTVKAASTYDNAPSGEFSLQAELSGDQGNALPRVVELLGNHPNPFNPVTTIRFSVPVGAARDHVLRVYDARGRLVRELGRGPVQPGVHEVVWDGRDASGASVSSGMYLYRLQVGDAKLAGKMVLLK